MKGSFELPNTYMPPLTHLPLKIMLTLTLTQKNSTSADNELASTNAAIYPFYYFPLCNEQLELPAFPQ